MQPAIAEMANSSLNIADMKIVTLYIDGQKRLEEGQVNGKQNSTSLFSADDVPMPVTQPSLARTSTMIKPAKFAPLHEPRIAKEPTEEIILPPPPLINPKSQALAAQMDRAGPIHERLMQSELARQRKHEALVAALDITPSQTRAIAARHTAQGEDTL
eukprot:CAMPEP_0172168586 /NCGR_PEP_ID=MMETSP1050-20130122/10231_1 /TAXON_ID=233186 /ORGANISM="Cryptomonas curvata, Strain CCAP979/52" /LENGTH=157 /DNA_ID=CAMNT_0012839547 /DNA_START=191 /DNA_END=660 /DNA_ORIENTATION=+